MIVAKIARTPSGTAMVTPDAEAAMLYTARVSSPHQDSGNIGLLGYCIRHGHWSVFEHAHMTVEIECPLYLATQMLRHRSFCFQQFSQRYAEASAGFHDQAARRQDTKNRQSSHDDLSEDVQAEWADRLGQVASATQNAYDWALDNGIAKECARAVLPQATMTRLYMTGNVRSWVHYLRARLHPSTQAEHRDVAQQIAALFCEAFPLTAAAAELSQ